MADKSDIELAVSGLSKDMRHFTGRYKELGPNREALVTFQLASLEMDNAAASEERAYILRSVQRARRFLKEALTLLEAS